MATLHALASFDEVGRPWFRIVENVRGELVLDAAHRPPAEGRSLLAGIDCMRLAAFSSDRPSLVVENTEGEYVVLPDAAPDLDQHAPLSLDDAELLAHPQPPVGHFGRRDDDVLQLTPWTPDDQLLPFEPEAPEFADVPVVDVTDGVVTAVRGSVSERLAARVLERVERLGEEGRYGVFTNPFGELSCFAVGQPVEPHQDVRRQAVLRAASVMDGASSLPEAAAVLRAYADRLDEAHAAGWQLPHPIVDDHGFPERA